jgi:hypothetical protein
MARWTKVKWTEAGQVTQLLGWKDDLDQAAHTPPEQFYAGLRRDGRLRDAAYYLGQSLPRFEAVVWATLVVRELGDPADPDGRCLRAALDWAADPTEARRRQAYAVSKDADAQSPARLAALAAFFSGGSMSPEDQPPVPAPRTTAGSFSAAAVLMAAIHTDDQAASLRLALDRGETIAANGVPAIGARAS